MTQIEQSSNYKAAEGCFIVRKADGFIMGEEIDLGSADSIDNYEDKAFTEEERKAFFDSLGIRQVELPERKQRRGGKKDEGKV